MSLPIYPSTHSPFQPHNPFPIKKNQNSHALPFPFVQPQRAMVFTKASFPRDRYEAAFQELWHAMWEQGHDVSKPDLLADVLARHFQPAEVRRILEAAGEPVWKQKLLDNTQRALERGAFGAPWFWVRNGKGEEEPFFGSDR